MKPIDQNAEWLETDGRGGFASGTVSGIRTRRSYALLLTTSAPTAGQVVLVNGFDAYVETLDGTFALSSQHYAPDVIEPDGSTRIEFFHYEPWPRWRYRLTPELAVEQELFILPGQSAVLLSWKLVGKDAEATLWIRPYFSGRDFDATQHKNTAFPFEAEQEGERWVWPLPDLPSMIATANGAYLHEPNWYRNFLYSEDEALGLNAIEDLASPGVFEFPISQKPAVLMFEAGSEVNDRGEKRTGDSLDPVETRFVELKTAERQRRKTFITPLHRAADAYLVRRRRGTAIVAAIPRWAIGVAILSFRSRAFACHGPTRRCARYSRRMGRRRFRGNDTEALS